jgi:hypothetical protein
MRKVLLFLIASCLFAAAMTGWALHTQYNKPADQELVASAAITTPSSPVPATPQPTVTPQPTPVLPDQVHLTVPYTMQSPFNVWDPLHEDACEEASLVMEKHHLDGTPMPALADADKEISALVVWEQQHGYGPSVTLTQLNQIAKDYYGLQNGQVVQLSSLDEVKQELAANHPVILGMAGKLLPNPYFSNGGPNYHMLMATGYDATGVVTNEPGTWHGEGYHYDSAAFYTAIHDWNSTDILLGQKAYLVFK